MYYLPTSCIVLFFLLSLVHHLSCASSEKELGWCQVQFQCGKVTVGFPFWGGNRPEVCSHPLLELRCSKNTTYLIISHQFYRVLHIDQTDNTLRLAKEELQGSFCEASFTDTTLPSEMFELLPTYKSLTGLYLCDPTFSYRSSYKCPGRGPVTVSQNLNYHDSCQSSFTIYVPKSFVPEKKELNMTRLESVVRKGFEVKVKIDEKACQKCSSSHGICSFKHNTQVCCKDASSSECNTLHLVPYSNELHRRCSGTFSCGNQRELFYPFWIPGREDCGPPDFKLNCNEEFAELSISSVKFRILEAIYASRVIRLARVDYINHLCTQNPPNALFSENVLIFAPETETLTIFYNCSREFTQYVPVNVGDFDCHDDDTRNYYVMTRNLSSPLFQGISGLLNGFREFCTRNVSIPASSSALDTLETIPSTDNLKKALEEGFEVVVNSDCRTCTDSGGACGYSQTQTSSGFVCYCADRSEKLTCHSRKKGLSTEATSGAVAASALVGVILLVTGLFCVISCQRKTSDHLRKHNLKALIPLKHYTYAHVQRITNSFAIVVGKGGFGTVYRGTLCDGRRVAVKILKDSKSDGEDFINEVASMSRTSHVNIVTLLGFCCEGSTRAIIYEFMENGSLDKFISSKRSSNMDWRRELYRIALGVARGLEYLHHGCRTRIIHFDIKPQNVPLDDNLCPKVSDFGLAKLCEKKESILSLLDTRGTIGYIAPELFSRIYGSFSHKSDVYSYGMLVLEMMGARNKERAQQNSTSNPSTMYFPDWIYKDLEKADIRRPIENGISSEEDALAKKMTLVGLWCIQPSPSDRPAMNRVVEMMEGNVSALEVPPRPVFQIPPMTFQDSSTLSENISVYAQVKSMNVQ